MLALLSASAGDDEDDGDGDADGESDRDSNGDGGEDGGTDEARVMWVMMMQHGPCDDDAARAMHRRTPCTPKSYFAQ